MSLSGHPLTPHRGLDDRGKLIPLRDEELRSHNAEAIRALDEIAELSDATDTEEVWDDVYRGIDEGRPHRRLFEGLY
jgi:hypothetical protein